MSDEQQFKRGFDQEEANVSGAVILGHQQQQQQQQQVDLSSRLYGAGGRPLVSSNAIRDGSLTRATRNRRVRSEVDAGDAAGSVDFAATGGQGKKKGDRYMKKNAFLGMNKPWLQQKEAPPKVHPFTSTWVPTPPANTADEKMEEKSRPMVAHVLKPAPAPQRKAKVEKHPKRVLLPVSLRPILGSSLDVSATAAEEEPTKLLQHRVTIAKPAASSAPSGTETTDLSMGERIQNVRKSIHRASLAGLRQEEEEAKAHADMAEEYEAYLLSPFAFIDKVIENPYTDEFVYLNPKGPYDLVIVRHDEVKPDHYYTMSRAGVTHFLYGETEFTSLDQWEREYFLYTKMMSIPFFARFRVWKAFVFWRSRIRRQKSNKCRKFLLENLYFCNPHLNAALHELRTLCYGHKLEIGLSQWTLFRATPANPYRLHEFEGEQEEQRMFVEGELRKLSGRVRDIVRTVCDKDLRHFLVQNGFRDPIPDPTSENFTLAQQEEFELEDDDYPQRVKHAEKAANRTRCRALCKFIRLCDYLIIDTLVTLCMEKTADLLTVMNREAEVPPEDAVAAEIQQNTSEADSYLSALGIRTNLGLAGGTEEKQKKVPLLVVEVRHRSLDGHNAHHYSHGNASHRITPADEQRRAELVFHPPAREVRAAIEKAVHSIVEVLMSVTRLIEDKNNFEEYLREMAEDADDEQGEPLKLQELVLREQAFENNVASLGGVVDRTFTVAAQYAARFNKYMDRYMENTLIDFNALRNADLDKFKTLVVKYEKQVQEFDLMMENAPLGILQVESIALKDQYRPSPAQCLEETRRLLPSVAAERTRDLYSQLHTAYEKIRTDPIRTEQFVELVSFLEKTEKNMDETEAENNFIGKLYDVIKEHSMDVSEEDMELFYQMRQQLKQLRWQITNTQNNMDNSTQQFSLKLKAEIEELIPNLRRVQKELGDALLQDAGAQVDQVIAYLKDRDAYLKELEATVDRYSSYQSVLDVDTSACETLRREVRKDMDIKLMVWQALKDWDLHLSNWAQQNGPDLDIAAVDAVVKEFKSIYSAAKKDWEENDVTLRIKSNFTEIIRTAPVVEYLADRNGYFRDDHWESITNSLGPRIKQGVAWTLGTLLEINAKSKRQEIEAIAIRAKNEWMLKEILDKIKDTWDVLMLPVKSHKGRGDAYVLDNMDKVQETLDESMVSINTLLSSQYVDVFRDEVTKWNDDLQLFSETMEVWRNCQKGWMYLEAIFGSPDIAKQLPSETELFKKVDKFWKDLMTQTNDNPKAMYAGVFPGRKEAFEKNNEILDKVQKMLEDFLETKRTAFPRFYFLSNDELLEILANAKDISAVQQHLRKCFDNIVSIDVDDVMKQVNSMCSAEGERVELGKNGRTPVRGNVETWLTALEQDMRRSLRHWMLLGKEDYDPNARKEWVLRTYAQVVMTVAQINWAYECESALRSNEPVSNMKNWLDRQIRQLSDLTSLVQGRLSKVDRKKVVTLITTDVRARDVTDRLVNDEVCNVADFTWQQQLRFYWETDHDPEDCFVRQSNARFQYGYEYMGVTSRLVITPLTDRCWMTITSALHLHYGASPAGPAGTGKTESTKDLAKAMGFLCVVFNCSEQIDYHMMNKLFSGLAQTGAWTCLDEFNRIDIEVLSVIAQQLQQVFRALSLGKTHFEFQQVPMKLEKGFGVMITMNPGYAGRTELPDNLKVLFRPVAMMIPDYALIAEIMLFAEGFETAQELSKKMTKLYKLSSEQLSQQDHYDFGMRAVKSVLVMAGSLKRAQPTLPEDEVLIKAMRDANVPKFLREDLPLFNAIVNDLFPGKVPQDEHNDELQMAIDDALVSMGLQKVDAFCNKVEQLFDTFNVRFGVMLVGPSGGGKSTCYNVLAKAMTALRDGGSKDERFERVNLHVLNPKSITMDELYGRVDPTTQEWSMGLASHMMLEACRDQSPEKHWVVFDGPVDALWIENMNTVLDDNMTLCLSNGMRIKLKPELRMLFEVQDLAVASPATVSRCGMVYVTPDDLGFMPYIRSWLPNLPLDMPANLKKYLVDLVSKHLPPGLEFLRSHCNEPVQTEDINIATSLCSTFQSLFTEANGVRFEDVKMEDLRTAVDMIFAYSYIWSVGGAVSELDRDTFAVWCAQQLAEFRVQRDVFGSYVDIPSLKWMTWESTCPEFKYDKELPYFQMLVPTIDTVRYSALLEMNLDIGRPTFFTGVTGVGKSVIISDLFDRRAQDKNWSCIPLTFSAQTGSRKTQLSIEGKLAKLGAGTLGAPPGKKAVIFVDDVNMPQVEEYGAQPPIELLRQLADPTLKFLWDRKKHERRTIKDTTLVCAAAPPGGGRSKLTARFTRHFHVLCLPSPSEDIMNHVFGSILKGFLAPFAPDIQALRKPIVSSCVSLYTDISKHMKPTPAKSHYTFNLRDLSSIFQGMLMIHESAVTDTDTVVRLMIHESQRTLSDRLVDDDDRNWFQEKVLSLLKSRFKLSWEQEQVFGTPIVFGDLVQRQMYEEYPDIKKVREILQEALEDYNESTSSGQMKLVFFTDALMHVARIARVLRQARGSALLIGVGGSGKQSLTRLACHMTDTRCMPLNITRDFGYEEFQEHLKAMMQIAGVEGKSVAFLLTEDQILQERFLEDVNGLLNSGEVPDLFKQDEMTKILEEMSDVVGRMGLPKTRDIIMSTFVNRVRDNLHVVLCLSPIGDAFRSRCRRFPSLINCTTLNWFDKWPRQALSSVARRVLKEVELPSEEVRDALCEMCVEVHQSMETTTERFWVELRRKVYITPKSYLDLLGLYLSLLGFKRREVSFNRDRLATGNRKIKETNAEVSVLQAKALELQPKLKQQGEATEKLIKNLKVKAAEADKVKEVVEKEEKRVSEQAHKVNLEFMDAKRDLDEALPVLEEAKAALGALNKQDISEVRGFKNPPPQVKMVLEAVCIMLAEKPDWPTAQKQMAGSDFLVKLQEYDSNRIDNKLVRKLETKDYLMNPNFTPEVMGNISVAATSLCKWVRAMVSYSKVEKQVKPKQEKMQASKALLDEAQAVLQEKQKELQSIVDNVNKLTKEKEDAEAKKRQLEEDMERTKSRLDMAGRLTSALADEQVRWAKDAKELTEQLELLVGDVFLAAACVSYIGPFTGAYRSDLTSKWYSWVKDKEIPCSTKGFSLNEVLGNAMLITTWMVHDLPTDETSVDSAILSLPPVNSDAAHDQPWEQTPESLWRWPLMIDPQGQAKKWIKKHYAQRLKVTRLSEANMLQTLTECVSNGLPLLIEDVREEVDTVLDPVLLKQVSQTVDMDKKTNLPVQKLQIKIGDRVVTYNRNFRLFLTTKLSNPHFLPNLTIKVNVLNFTVTPEGLQDQLLGDVLLKEKREIELKRRSIASDIANKKASLRRNEESILRKLSEIVGNILDDHGLVTSLEESKASSKWVQEMMKDQLVQAAEMDKIRERYRAVARRGAILFFVISSMARVDPMYQYSLLYFKGLFEKAMDNSARPLDADDVPQRVRSIVDYLTLSVYNNVCRGLFESHKSIFSFLICAQIMRGRAQMSTEAKKSSSLAGTYDHNNIILDVEWNLLVRGPVGTDLSGCPPNPNPEVFKEKTWTALYALELVLPKSFQGICEHVANEQAEWTAYQDDDMPHERKLPGTWEHQLTSFQKLLVLKAFRVEKMMFGFKKFVSDNLGAPFTQSARVDLDDVFKDVDFRTPVIFVLSQGADPTSMIHRYARDYMGDAMEDNFEEISLGQGQGEKARSAIEAAMKHGGWVLLQNCHLAKSWMPKLAKICEILGDQPEDTKAVNSDFRLLLTSMPADYFPVSVLQSGVKITNEPPKGLRSNLHRSYLNPAVVEASDEVFETCAKPHAWKKLLFGLCFFHGVIQERKIFGPLGWNKMYEFNDSDLKMAIQVLRMFLDEQPEIPWDALRYVCGQINYGGRVTDDWDRRCLMTNLERFFTPDILDDEYKFSASGTYKAPVDGSFQDYISYIEGLPENANPEIFGMHQNANLSFQLQETEKILSIVLSLEPRMTGGGGGGRSSDDIVMETAKSIAEELPLQMDPLEAHPSILQETEHGVKDSLSTVLLQEVERFNRLLRHMASSLVELQKAIMGEVVMSPALDTMYTNFLNNQVPELWARFAYPSLKPLASWVEDLQDRVEFMRLWLKQGEPTAFWISGFFYPQGFCTGTLQRFARKYQEPIDKLSFSFNFLDTMEADEVESPEDGVCIYGLFMDGARWDSKTNTIEDSLLGELHPRMPIIHFMPTLNHDRDPADYAAPVYKTSVRQGVLSTTGESTNFVLAVDLPSSRPPEYWTLKGAAFLCQLDE